MVNKNFLFLFVFLMLGVSLVGAVPPVQTTTIAVQGLEIEATNSLYLEQNETHIFHFRVYNASNNVYISPADVNCSMGILDNYGNYILSVPEPTSTGYRYNVNVLGGNFTTLGVYHKGINCMLDDGTAGAVLTQSFEVTETGLAKPEPLIIMGFSIILILMLSYSVVMIVKAMGHIIDKDFDLMDLAIMWGAYFGLLAISLLANVYLGNAVITDWLDLFVSLYAFPMVILPIIALLLSIFNMNKKAKAEANRW